MCPFGLLSYSDRPKQPRELVPSTGACLLLFALNYFCSFLAISCRSLSLLTIVQSASLRFPISLELNLIGSSFGTDRYCLYKLRLNDVGPLSSFVEISMTVEAWGGVGGRDPR